MANILWSCYPWHTGKNHIKLWAIQLATLSTIKRARISTYICMHRFVKNCMQQVQCFLKINWVKYSKMVILNVIGFEKRWLPWTFICKYAYIQFWNIKFNIFWEGNELLACLFKLHNLFQWTNSVKDSWLDCLPFR